MPHFPFEPVYAAGEVSRAITAAWPPWRKWRTGSWRPRRSALTKAGSPAPGAGSRERVEARESTGNVLRNGEQGPIGGQTGTDCGGLRHPFRPLTVLTPMALGRVTPHSSCFLRAYSTLGVNVWRRSQIARLRTRDCVKGLSRQRQLPHLAMEVCPYPDRER